MPTAIDTLNDAQVRHAIKLFYDHLPDAAWEGGRKPAIERVNTVIQSIRKQAAAEQQAVLEALLNDTDPRAEEAQAAVARTVLQQALASPTLAPTAQQAIGDAAEPNMFLDPITGVIIIGMLLATSNIDRDADGALHVHLGANAAGILSALNVPQTLAKLPAVLGALPKTLISRLS